MNQDSPNKTAHTSVKDGPVLRDHVFDGIEEFDQKLPNWWLFTFYIAIVFYIGWWIVYYNTDLMQSPAEKINATMATIEAKKQKELTAMLDQLDDKVLVEWSQNSGIIAEGEVIYKGICIACHGPDLKGGIGRSLMDNEWAYGGKPMDLFNQVLNGTPKGSKGFNGMPMQAFKNDLGPEKVAKVVAFVISKSPSVEK